MEKNQILINNLVNFLKKQGKKGASGDLIKRHLNISSVLFQKIIPTVMSQFPVAKDDLIDDKYYWIGRVKRHDPLDIKQKEQEMVALLKLYDDGLTMKEICKQLKISDRDFREIINKQKYKDIYCGLVNGKLKYMYGGF